MYSGDIAWHLPLRHLPLLRLLLWVFFFHFSQRTQLPIVSAMSIIIFFTVLGTLDLPVFRYITPYLFTTHMVTWKEFFDEKLNASNEAVTGSIQNVPGILTSVVVLTVHIVGLLAASVFVMKKKDVLS